MKNVVPWNFSEIKREKKMFEVSIQSELFCKLPLSDWLVRVRRKILEFFSKTKFQKQKYFFQNEVVFKEIPHTTVSNTNGLSIGCRWEKNRVFIGVYFSLYQQVDHLSTQFLVTLGYEPMAMGPTALATRSLSFQNFFYFKNWLSSFFHYKKSLLVNLHF